MINIKTKLCICGKYPAFNFEGITPPICCIDCKDDKMVDVKSIRCHSDFCNTIVGARTKYKGYCTYCFINLFPEEEITRNYKTKEQTVVNFVRDNFKDYSWKADKRIDGGSSLRRPDLFLNLENQIIIVEVDENQHKLYEDICENKRIMEISKDVNHKPIVFIRFNPDKYIDKNNKNIPSCWSINKNTGVLKINYVNKWNERLNSLKEQIDYWSIYDTDKTVEVVQLYYDENL
jgi:hypothetical protein